MKKLKERLTFLLIAMVFCGLIYGIGYIKHKIWRTEHPQAKIWAFFVSETLE